MCVNLSVDSICTQPGQQMSLKEFCTLLWINNDEDLWWKHPIPWFQILLFARRGRWHTHFFHCTCSFPQLPFISTVVFLSSRSARNCIWSLHVLHSVRCVERSYYKTVEEMLSWRNKHVSNEVKLKKLNDYRACHALFRRWFFFFLLDYLFLIKAAMTWEMPSKTITSVDVKWEIFTASNIFFLSIPVRFSKFSLIFLTPSLQLLSQGRKRTIATFKTLQTE